MSRIFCKVVLHMLICHLNSSINLSTSQIHSPPKQILLCSIIVTVVHILLMSPITAAIQLLWFSSNPCLPFFLARIRTPFFFANMGAAVCLNLLQLTACSKSRNRTYGCSKCLIYWYALKFKNSNYVSSKEFKWLICG